jgi:hypothetical protein
MDPTKLDSFLDHNSFDRSGAVGSVSDATDDLLPSDLTCDDLR